MAKRRKSPTRPRTCKPYGAAEALRRKRGRTFNRQMQGAILSVHRTMVEEFRNGGPLIDPRKAVYVHYFSEFTYLQLIEN